MVARAGPSGASAAADVGGGAGEGRIAGEACGSVKSSSPWLQTGRLQ